MKRAMQSILLLALTALPSASLMSDEKSDVIQAAMRFVFQEAGVTDPSVTVEAIEGNFARVAVVSVSGTTDPATAYLKKSGGKWTVLTLGTAFEDSELSDYGIPYSVR